MSMHNNAPQPAVLPERERHERPVDETARAHALADALVASPLIAAGDAADWEAVRLFGHIASVEHLWYSRIVGRQPAHARMAKACRPQSRAILPFNTPISSIRLVTTATDAEMARVVPYTNSAGVHFDSPVSDIVTHVTSHGSYHRGQIATRIRATEMRRRTRTTFQFSRRSQLP